MVRLGLITAIATVVVIVGLSGSDYAIFVVNIGLLAAVSAIALNLLTGYAGQVSIGNAAFLALGAWTAVVAGSHLGFLPTVLLAGFVAAVAGFVVGVPSLRLRGLYLSLTTLALQFVVTFAMNKYQEHEKAPAGFRLPITSIAGIELVSDRSWYALLLVILALTILVSWWLVTGKPGRAWVAIREHDVAAALVGVDVTRYKLLAFITSSFLIGIAGALSAYYTRTVSYETYTLDLAIAYVAMVIIGGLASVWGSVVGAFIVTLLPLMISTLWQSYGPTTGVGEFLLRNLPYLEAMAYGFLVLAFLYFEPRGIAGLTRRLIRSRIVRLNPGANGG
jgi:branched-chain amino acid transport system permease protein